MFVSAVSAESGHLNPSLSLYVKKSHACILMISTHPFVVALVYGSCFALLKKKTSFRFKKSTEHQTLLCRSILWLEIYKHISHILMLVINLALQLQNNQHVTNFACPLVNSCV